MTHAARDKSRAPRTGRIMLYRGGTLSRSLYRGGTLSRSLSRGGTPLGVPEPAGEGYEHDARCAGQVPRATDGEDHALPGAPAPTMGIRARAQAMRLSEDGRSARVLGRCDPRRGPCGVSPERADGSPCGSRICSRVARSVYAGQVVELIPSTCAPLDDVAVSCPEEARGRCCRDHA